MDIKLGDVIRMGEWPFSDAVVVSVEENGEFTLARPYCYASETASHPLTGVELVSHLTTLGSWRKVDTARIR